MINRSQKHSSVRLLQFTTYDSNRRKPGYNIHNAITVKPIYMLYYLFNLTCLVSIHYNINLTHIFTKWSLSDL